MRYWITVKRGQSVTHTFRDQISEWAYRYLPSEAIGILTALIAASVVRMITPHPLWAALAGTWGENIGFYCSFSIREVYAHRKTIDKTHVSPHHFTDFIGVLRNLVLEFGPAEVFDSFVSRPFFLFVVPGIIGNFLLGIVLGKLIADIVFYIIVSISYHYTASMLQKTDTSKLKK